MGIKDLFVPDWKHSNPKTRISAIKNLSDLRLLKEIFIGDKDLLVKKAALDKINDPQIYEHLFNESQDLTLKEIIREKLKGRFFDKILAISADETDIDLDLFSDLTEEQLVKIFLESKNHKVKEKTLTLLKNDKVLFNLVMDDRCKEYALILIEKINDDHYLKRISRESLSKKLKKKGLERLKDVLKKENRIIPEIAKKEVSQLLSKLRDCEQRTFNEENKKKIFEIKVAFEALNPPESIPNVLAFKKLLEEIETNQSIYESTKKQLSDLIQQVKNQPLDFVDEQDPMEFINKIEEEYKKVGKSRLKFEEKEFFETHFYEEIKKFKSKYLEQRRALENLKLSEKMARGAVKELESLVRNLEKNYHINKNELFMMIEKSKSDFYQNIQENEKLHSLKDYFTDLIKQAEARLHDLKKHDLSKDEIEKKLLALCETVEKALPMEEFRRKQETILGALGEWKKIGNDLPEIKDKFQKRFQMVLDHFFKEQKESKQNQEWQRWFNLKQKQELVAQIEQVVNQEEIVGMGTFLMDARDKWKNIGPIPRSEGDQLWEQFNLLCQKGFDRCFVKKKELYSSLKEILILLQEITNDEDLGKINYKETWNKVKEIQESWNAIGHLPKKMESSLYEDFRKLVDSFIDKRKRFYELQDKDRQLNAGVKKQIIKDLEKLLKGKDDPNEKAYQIRDLQKKWKEVGPLPLAEAQELNDNFYKICREFFGDLDQAKEEILRKKEEVVNEFKTVVDELRNEKNFKDIEETFESFKARFDDAGALSANQDEDLWKELSAIMRSYNREREHFLKDQESGIKDLLKIKLALLKELENLYFDSDKIDQEKRDEILKRWDEVKKLPNGKDQQMVEEQKKSIIDLMEREIKGALTPDRSQAEQEEELKEKLAILQKLRVLVKIVYPEKNLQEIDQFVDRGQELEIAFKMKGRIVAASPKQSLLNAQNEAYDLIKSWWNLRNVDKKTLKNLNSYYQEIIAILFSEHF